MINLGIIGLVNFSEWSDPDYPETGGINSVVKNILPYLSADRIVLYGYTYKKENLLRERKLSETVSVFPIIYIPPKSKLPKRVFGFFYGWRLKKALKKHRINVVYSHAEELTIWLTGSKIPYIHHLHTFVNVLDISARKSAKVEIFRKAWENMRKKVITGSAKIVAVNKDVIEMGKALIGADRIIAFPNYVDLKQFTFAEANELEEKLGVENVHKALFLGRLAYVKGLELFVDVIEELNARAKGKRWVGILVGTGDYELDIRNYISAKRISDNFLFTGSVNDPLQLSKLYSLADIFLITSYSESVPITLLESLACGTPVVSTDVGIAKDVLTANTGFVIESREAADFAEKVLLSLPLKKKESLLANAFEYSVERASQLLNDEIKRQALGNAVTKPALL